MPARKATQYGMFGGIKHRQLKNGRERLNKVKKKKVNNFILF